MNTHIALLRAVLFIKGRHLKQFRYPLTEEWIKKIWYIYTMTYYAAANKQTKKQKPKTNKIHEICSQMDGTHKN